MKIVHVASIGNNLTQGIAVVVPQHVKAQAQLAQVCLVNIRNIDVMKDGMQYGYRGVKNFPDYLLAPFDKPDIVVFHGVNIPEYIKIYKELLKKDIPYVIVPHGENTDSALKKKWLKKKIAYLLLFNRFIRKAAGLQCLSQGEYDETHTSDKKFIVPNGMDLHEHKPLHLGRDIVKLLYIGRLEWQIKGLDMMIEAVAQNRGGRIELAIYGPGGGGRKEEVVKLIRKYKAEDVVLLHDAVFGEDKTRAYMDCDLFIQTSRTEGMPMGVLEALSYGIPVIVTKGTRLKELVEQYDAGYTAENNAGSITNAIKEALSTKELWELKGYNGLKLISENYLWENVAKRAVGEYGKRAK